METEDKGELLFELTRTYDDFSWEKRLFQLILIMGFFCLLWGFKLIFIDKHQSYFIPYFMFMGSGLILMFLLKEFILWKKMPFRIYSNGITQPNVSLRMRINNVDLFIPNEKIIDFQHSSEPSVNFKESRDVIRIKYLLNFPRQYGYINLEITEYEAIITIIKMVNKICDENRQNT
jgi:hypothetical protein